MQHFPDRMHSFLNVRAEQGILFISIQFGLNKDQIVFNAVILDIMTGIYMVYVIVGIIKQFSKIDWMTGIHTQAFLHVIEIEFSNSEISFVTAFNIRKQALIIILAFLVKFF